MNIYQIEQNLLDILDTIEENGGELTEELEQQLVITQESFKDKIQQYTNIIKSLNNDINSIKLEQVRLKTLADIKAKAIDKFNNIIITATEQFGSTKSSGTKYIDYGTGQVSIRKSKAVDVDTDLLKRFSEAITYITAYNKQFNQLDVVDRIEANNIINFLNTSDSDTMEDKAVYDVTEGDLNHANIEFTAKVPLSEIIDGKSYSILKEIAKHTEAFKVDVSVSKTDLKKELEENGACAPNLAKLVEHKSLTIK